ncbi:hypothetical protein [Methylobacterium fujisawaense]|uniref:hypothetical protein n=1 Tax=Methylobacterium fujisawaense TaxID=107400 RepID=UPI002F35E85E
MGPLVLRPAIAVVVLQCPADGAKTAFDIPLSRSMVRSILRAILAGRMLHPDKAEFRLFQADSAAGHMTEHKEKRDILSEWGNELRQSCRTLAQPAGVPELDGHLLMNRSLSEVERQLHYTRSAAREPLARSTGEDLQVRPRRCICQQRSNERGDQESAQQWPRRCAQAGSP